MQPQRRTMTDRLADVIHIIQFGNKSGMLTVERGSNSTKEEGYITFVDGRIVEARVGQYNGPAAFNYLATWQTCFFALMSHTTGQNPVAQLPSPKSNTSATVARISGAYNSTARRGDIRSDYQKSGTQPAPPHRQPRGEETILHPERTPLSRIHRRLLILVDGQRGLDDFARLIARRPNEVQELLNDLVLGGFIRQ